MEQTHTNSTINFKQYLLNKQKIKKNDNKKKKKNHKKKKKK